MNNDIEILIEKKKLDINLSALPKKEKKKIIDILGVKKRLYQKSPSGLPYNFWEENIIKKQYPDFYKKNVKGRKSKYYVWLPRGA